MIKKNVVDSSRYTSLMDERLKIKSIERFRPSDIFATPHYLKDVAEKEKIKKTSEEIYNVTRKSLWPKCVTDSSDASYSIGNLIFERRDSDECKQEYLKKVHQENEINLKQEIFIRNTSAKVQKLFREYYSDIVLGSEENKRKNMISNINNYDTTLNSKLDDKEKIFRQRYPAYSNIFNDENLSIHNELENNDFNYCKSRIVHKNDVESDSVAKILSPEIPLKTYDSTYKCRTDENKNMCDGFEVKMAQLISSLTPAQRNLSSKLHGTEFYYKAINNPGVVFSVKFRLKNTTPEHNEKFIQEIAMASDTFAFQINIDLDPVLWNHKGLITGKLRFFDQGLIRFKEKLGEFGIELEVVGEVQKEEINTIK
ncbi:hypothetical protein FG386_002544 [Cryptosporidium ryanae]|uniref:uncharacterized protein n=1 Tax=Cryptosporidium ryanae TaxID=515981 RepID=UPI00351A6F4E|nr:hypothetical protein FG386_002544 [Cryptosporidium ryanae]